MTPKHVEELQQHMCRYLKTMKVLYMYSVLTPNHHLSLHLPWLFENFGPLHTWACFIFKCCLWWLKFIKTSNKFGEPSISLGHCCATSLICEKLTKGLLGSIATKYYPSVCLTLESLTFCRMQFSIATNSLGNSYVVFKRKSGNDEPWSAGSIQMIFHLPIEETTHGPFFVIKPYLPLNTADAKFDPYRKFLFAAGQLVYDECGDLWVCTLGEVLCHFAHTPYKSPDIPKQCIHVLPLDRVRASFLSDI